MLKVFYGPVHNSIKQDYFNKSNVAVFIRSIAAIEK